MLSAEQLIDLEIRIGDEIERLQGEMENSTVEREAIAPDVSIGRLSRLDSMQMREVAREAQRRREERLRLLEAARDRLDEGEYGFCERCGGEIGWERLDAQPEAVRCGICAR
ncbi:MAG: TraR/DksA family transcriptional regulator [Akkermansiaceae bacterium]|nr:TraR/DksA family transcriptional regulator [Akkermansiaceae bacterium]MCP5550755.1 TraR/DksA family transcriptional regulator [Akkermansiaceae bacterium]